MNGKFKVWDSEHKCFYDAVGNDFYLNGDGRLVEFCPFDGMKEVKEQLRIVFSTGKTDKNGVELFDKDIAKYRYKGIVYECLIEYSKSIWILKPIKQPEIFWILGAAIVEKIGSSLER